MPSFQSMGRVNTGGANTIGGGAPNFGQVNPIMGVMDREQTRLDTQHQADDDKQHKILTDMINNPQMAPQIAAAGGVQLTPELQNLLKDPLRAKLTVDGAALAKNLQIGSPQAAQAFTGAYVQSGGNIMEASKAIEGMDQNRPHAGSGMTPQDYGYDWTKDPRIPTELRMENDRLKNSMGASPEEWKALSDKLSPYLSGGQPAPLAPTSAPGAPVPTLSDGQVAPQPPAPPPVQTDANGAVILPGQRGFVNPDGKVNPATAPGMYDRMINWGGDILAPGLDRPEANKMTSNTDKVLVQDAEGKRWRVPKELVPNVIQEGGKVLQ